jgi:SAM-dependent methyltransferase
MKSYWKIFRRALVRALIKSPFDLAHYFCKGKGLEIGAMSSPYAFGSGCVVKYADIYETNELKNIVGKIPLPNLYQGFYVPISYQLKPPRYGLEMIEPNSFDFVYSSHSLEHTPNPIWALIEQLRVVKPGGIVYAAIPNKSHTYDAKRTPTSVEKLTQKYLDLDFEHTFEEALDVVTNTIDHPLYELNKQNANVYAQQILDEKEGIHHFFVFDELNTLAMLIFVAKTTRATIEYFSAAEGRDIQFALRKPAVT